MTLTCKVSAIYAADQFTDGHERIAVRIEEADPQYREIRFINWKRRKLNDTFLLTDGQPEPASKEAF